MLALQKTKTKYNWDYTLHYNKVKELSLLVVDWSWNLSLGWMHVQREITSNYWAKPHVLICLALLNTLERTNSNFVLSGTQTRFYHLSLPLTPVHTEIKEVNVKMLSLYFWHLFNVSNIFIALFYYFLARSGNIWLTHWQIKIWI